MKKRYSYLIFFALLIIFSAGKANALSTPPQVGEFRYDQSGEVIMGSISSEDDMLRFDRYSTLYYIAFSPTYNKSTHVGTAYGILLKDIGEGYLYGFYSTGPGSSDDTLLWEVSSIKISPPGSGVIVPPTQNSPNFDPSNPTPPTGSDGSWGNYQGHTGTDQGPLTKPRWKTIFEGEEVDSYEGWIKLVWKWAMIIMIPISVLVLSAAGVLYMVSEGDSTRIGLAKKLIIGVFSGVGLLILARLLLTVIGLEGFYNV